jgi:hypothetical protein
MKEEKEAAKKERRGEDARDCPDALRKLTCSDWAPRVLSFVTLESNHCPRLNTARTQNLHPSLTWTLMFASGPGWEDANFLVIPEPDS